MEGLNEPPGPYGYPAPTSANYFRFLNKNDSFTESQSAFSFLAEAYQKIMDGVNRINLPSFSFHTGTLPVASMFFEAASRNKPMTFPSVQAHGKA